MPRDADLAVSAGGTGNVVIGRTGAAATTARSSTARRQRITGVTATPTAATPAVRVTLTGLRVLAA